jgi:hypothetical protein
MQNIHKLLSGLVILLAANNPAYADIKNGKSLHEAKCSTCHLVGGDHSVLYKRDNRKIKNYAKLKGQVSFCAQNFNVDWFPEEEKDVVNYINEQYYHFKK